MHAFHRQDDFYQIRDFLIKTYKLTNTFQNWIPSMFENMWRGPGGSEYQDKEDEYVKIWKNTVEEIVAVTICKPSGDCRIFIHPDFRNHEDILFEFLEKQRTDMKSVDTPIKMYFVVEAGDTLRENLLTQRGYENKGICEHNRVLPEYYEVITVSLPEGYKIRHAVVEQDFEQYIAVQGSVFPHCTNMTRNLLKIYSEAEFYFPELDLVAVAPDGTFAAFATGRIDPVSKLAEVEPVGVHPDHRRKGLAKAVVLECIRRLQKHNAERIVILGAASTEEATHLYDSLGFNKTDVNVWVKEV